MDRFLKAKHWQIFLLMVGIPFGLQLIMMPITVMNHNPTLMFTIMPIVIILYVVVFFGWFWAIGTGLHHKLPETVKMNIKQFKIFLTIPIIYILFISIFMCVSALGLIESDEPPGFAIFGIMGVIFPIHLFSMFCIFYALWFNAKTIKSIEFQRPVTFGDFAGEFFLMWLFPIGIWFVQPKINKMIEE